MEIKGRSLGRGKEGKGERSMEHHTRGVPARSGLDNITPSDQRTSASVGSEAAEICKSIAEVVSPLCKQEWKSRRRDGLVSYFRTYLFGTGDVVVCMFEEGVAKDFCSDPLERQWRVCLVESGGEPVTLLDDSVENLARLKALLLSVLAFGFKE